MTLKIGQIVHLKEDVPRKAWKMSKVTSLIKSQDNEIILGVPYHADFRTILTLRRPKSFRVNSVRANSKWFLIFFNFSRFLTDSMPESIVIQCHIDSILIYTSKLSLLVQIQSIRNRPVYLLCYCFSN